MADRSRNRLVTALLSAAAPLLVVGGLLATTAAGDHDQPANARADSAGLERAFSVPVPASSSSEAAPSSRGVRPDVVVVPALGVRAPVTPIATEDGALNPPSDPQQVGWWSGGARPGSSAGASVLTGHTVHTGGGAFDDLEQLTPGDEVVVRAGRTQVSYAVASVRVLSKARLARQSSRIFGRSGAGRLVLITCEDWDGTAYRSNVVVTARPLGT